MHGDLSTRPPAGGASRLDGLWSPLGCLLTAVALTLAMAAPVLLSPSTRLFGAEIVGRHEAPFIMVSLFEWIARLEGLPPLGLYTQPATDWVGAVLAAVTGDGVIAHNLLVLASFPLAALFAYQFSSLVTGSRRASWLAGLLYAFAPFHVAQSAYHVHGSQTQWLPLYLSALWLCVEKARARRLALLVTAAILVAASNFYYGLMAIVLTPVALAGFVWSQERFARDRQGGLRATLATLGLLALGGFSYIALRVPQVWEQREQLAFPRSDLAQYGAHSISYLTPPLEHPLLESGLRQLWEERGLAGLLEQQITLGLGLLCLAVLGVALYARGDRSREMRSVPALALLGLGAFLVSLAPSEEAGPLAALAPSSLLHQVLPMFRAYARFGLVVFLAVSVLGCAAFVRLLTLQDRRWRAAGLVLLLVAGLELLPFPPFRWRDVLPTSAHRHLNDREGAIKLLDCVQPSRLAGSPQPLRFRHQIDAASSPRSGADACGDPDHAFLLADQGFTHVVARRPSPLASWLEGRPDPVGLSLERDWPDSLLFTVERGLERDRPWLTFAPGGFHWREYRPEGSFRWMKSSGSLLLTNRRSEPLTVDLELRLHAFPTSRFVELLLDERREVLEVGTEPAPFVVSAIGLKANSHRALQLRAPTGAVVADSVLGNGDPRALSVALWDWKVVMRYDQPPTRELP